jgi:hypothetical protein
VALGIVALVAGTAPLPAAEEVVELPPFEVVSPGKILPPWQYVALENKEVLSRCSTAITREFIEVQSRLTQLLQLMLPAELQVKLSAPQLFILTDQNTTPAAAKEAVQGFSGTSQPPAGGWSAREQAVRFLPNLRLNDVDEVAVYAIVDERNFRSERLVLTMNHVRDVLVRRTPALPSWYTVGVLTLFKDVSFLSDGLEFASYDWVTAQETENLRRDADHPRTLLPMRELFAGPGTGEGSDDGETLRLWRVQSALLVRWALDGDDPARRTGFWKLVAQAAAEPMREAMVQEHLGLSYADLRDRLSDYLPGSLRERLRLRAEKLTPVPPFSLRLASPAEIGRIKGDWERMEIAYVKARYPQYTDKYAQQAHRTLTEAYGKGVRDPELLAVIGLYEIEVGNGVAARSFLEDAAKAKVVRPRVYLELARLRYAEATASLNEGSPRLSTAQANQVLAPLATAWTQAPPLVEAFVLAADVWVRSASVLEQPQWGFLEEGRRLFPGHGILTYYTAVLKLQHGDDACAAALITQGLQLSLTTQTRARFEQLRDLLQRRGSAAAPP